MKSLAGYLIVIALAAATGCRGGDETARTGSASTGEESASTEVKATKAASTEAPAKQAAADDTPAAAPSSDGAMAAQSHAAAGTAEEVRLPSGLKYEDLNVGDGTVAKNGMRASVHYTGWLTDGTRFDSSVDRGQPFSFVIGQGQVIRGWEEGVQGMRVGGKRKLTIPPSLGYGERGYPGAIPPNATLVFDVELLDVQ